MVGRDGHRGPALLRHPRSRVTRSGYGRQMVEAGETWLRERGVVKVQLPVHETNTKVIAFYERLGFEVAPGPSWRNGWPKRRNLSAAGWRLHLSAALRALYCRH
jgi:RimJ/RimL family protein N-acetyltransferase